MRPILSVCAEYACELSNELCELHPIDGCLDIGCIHRNGTSLLDVVELVDAHGVWLAADILLSVFWAVATRWTNPWRKSEDSFRDGGRWIIFLTVADGI